MVERKICPFCKKILPEDMTMGITPICPYCRNPVNITREGDENYQKPYFSPR
ncbi:hypothetical protein HYV87_00990 [Candidatus Woesearchaeota archaeon]|nr:hypothetical protein [Candidatus Woesearchaeota archaeon]